MVKTNELVIPSGSEESSRSEAFLTNY